MSDENTNPDLPGATDGPPVEASDEDVVAASNLDVAQRKAHEDIEPVEPPEKSEAGSPSAKDNGNDPDGEKVITYNNNPYTAQGNTGDAGEYTRPAGDTQITPIQAELDRAALTFGNESQADIAAQNSDHANGTVSANDAAGKEGTPPAGDPANADNNGAAPPSNPNENTPPASGFGALSNVENK